MTEDEIRQMAESLAQQELGVSLDEAWRRICDGQYEGTILASKLHQLKFLLGEL